MSKETAQSGWAVIGLTLTVTAVSGCGLLPPRRADVEVRPDASTRTAAAPAHHESAAKFVPEFVPLAPESAITEPAQAGTEPAAAGRARLALPTIPLDSPPAAPAASPPPDLAAWKSLGARIAPPDGATAVTIDAAGLPISDADLIALSGQPELRNLNLRSTQVTDVGLSVLVDLPLLEFLGLSDTAVTDAGLPSLLTLRKLRYLTLADTAITDGAVETLGALGNLEGLNLKGTGITSAGAATLRAGLPNCRIVVDDSLLTGDLRFQQDLASPDARPPQLLLPQGAYGESTHNDREASRTIDPEFRLNAMLEERFGDPQLLATLGDLYRERGDLDAAVTAYREAVRRAPVDPDLRYRLGIAEAERGDWTSSRQNLTLAVGPAAAEYNQAVILHRQERIADSRAALDRSLAWDPDFAPSREMLTWIAQPEYRPATPRNTTAPLAVELVMNALRHDPWTPPRDEWKVAIRPVTVPTMATAAEISAGSEPVGRSINRAVLGDAPVPVIQPLSVEMQPRYDW